MTFIPYPGKIVIEPIDQQSIILSDDHKYEEMGRVVQGNNMIHTGDIVFFLAYGVEQTPEYEGKTYYVVPCDERFIIGYIPCEPSTNPQNASPDGSTTGASPEPSAMEPKNDALNVSDDNSSMSVSQIGSTSPLTSEKLSSLTIPDLPENI